MQNLSLLTHNTWLSHSPLWLYLPSTQCSWDGKQGVKLSRRGGGSSSCSELLNNFMKYSQTHAPTLPVFIYAYCISTSQGRHEAPPALCLVCGTCCSPLHFLGLVSSSEALLAALIYFMAVALPCFCLCLLCLISSEHLKRLAHWLSDSTHKTVNTADGETRS